METKPVRVLLTASTQEEMNSLFEAFLGEKGKVYVASMATSLEMLRSSLRSVRVEVVVLDCEILAHLGEGGIVSFLAKELMGAVCVLLLPLAMRHFEGRLREIETVRKIFVKPVELGRLPAEVYTVGVTERSRLQAVSPASLYAREPILRRDVAVTGTRVFAFGAVKGGPGKTTIAMNFAYRLSQTGIRTCLLGFDTPDDIAVWMNLRPVPNSLNFFRRPGREGFAASLQRKDGLEIVLAPQSPGEADKVAQIPPEKEGSIASLVEAARSHHPPYAAIVLDLPPTESEWMIQPLLRCNTLILVILPSVADCNKLISMIELLTCFDARYKLPRSAIFAVVNMITPEDNFTVDAMQTVIREQLDGYCPPIIATIPFNPKVRTRQNLGILPVSSLDDFTRGIDQIVDYFYRETLGLHPSRVAKKGLLEGLKRIKIKW